MSTSPQSKGPSLPSSEMGRFSRLRGVWRSHALGILLEIHSSTYRLYEETRVSCLFILEGSLKDLSEFYVDLRISPQGQSFSARQATGVTRVRYRRLSKMPEACSSVSESSYRDPVFNFDVFWHTFAERYAMFGLRGVDWQVARKTYRSQVTPETGTKHLFAIFVEMLEPLRDGHVRLKAPCGRFEAVDLQTLEQRVLTANDRRHGIDAATVIADLHAQLRATVHQNYLGNVSRRAGHGLLEWGQLNPRTGYLVIRAMAGQSGRHDNPRKDQYAAASALKRTLRDLGHLPALVIDLRGNSGGYDGVALRIAGYFTDRKRLAFTKIPSKSEGYGSRQQVYVEPRDRPRYKGKIILLTSGLTASAAEIFVLALLRNPRVTRIGEPTQGILSDMMQRHLPNGWTLNLSNELYEAADGVLYEDSGIPPDIEIPFLDRRSIQAGRDRMLDYVLEHPRLQGPTEP